MLHVWQPSVAVQRGLREAVCAVGSAGVAGLAFPALLTEAAGEGWPDQLASILAHTPPHTPHTPTLPPAPSGGAGWRGGGDVEGASKRDRARALGVARMTQVIRAVWDAVRDEQQHHIRGLHVIVGTAAPPLPAHSLTLAALPIYHSVCMSVRIHHSLLPLFACTTLCLCILTFSRFIH